MFLLKYSYKYMDVKIERIQCSGVLDAQLNLIETAESASVMLKDEEDEMTRRWCFWGESGSELVMSPLSLSPQHRLVGECSREQIDCTSAFSRNRAFYTRLHMLLHPRANPINCDHLPQGHEGIIRTVGIVMISILFTRYYIVDYNVVFLGQRKREVFMYLFLEFCLILFLFGSLSYRQLAHIEVWADCISHRA